MPMPHGPLSRSLCAGKVLCQETISPNVRAMQYAVRGQVPQRAEQIARELRQGQGPKRPYDEVLFCNIGNPQSVGQKPLTFHRQVIALCDHPDLLSHPDVGRLFPEDAVERARQALLGIPGGTGAYSHSQGVAQIRRDVARFIEQRDGGPTVDPEDIFLSNGASTAITLLMQVLLSRPTDAVLIPIPQYPIYTALIELLHAKAVGYYLDEDAGWSLSLPELTRAVREARASGLDPRAMVIINPGNPTGQCLDEATLRRAIEFCREEHLLLLADEVYQDNVYAEDRAFVSARKVLRSLGPAFEGFELVSFHSTSKGLLGECGLRGGYMELSGLDPLAKAELYKLASVGLCPNLVGQVMTQLMVCPPRPGDPSFATYAKERAAIFGSLKRKAALLVETWSRLPGVTCQPVQGAMYTFPRLELPEHIVAKAGQRGLSPDTAYCLSLLEHTGICTVPGSGFGQVPGTLHLRMTFLPPEERLAEALVRLRAYHLDVMSGQLDPLQP